MFHPGEIEDWFRKVSLFRFQKVDGWLNFKFSRRTDSLLNFMMLYVINTGFLTRYLCNTVALYLKPTWMSSLCSITAVALVCIRVVPNEWLDADGSSINSLHPFWILKFAAYPHSFIYFAIAFPMSKCKFKHIIYRIVDAQVLFPLFAVHVNMSLAM
jgi:hypothetical protein